MCSDKMDQRLTLRQDERFLTAQLQEAAVQDGGTHATRQNNTRQLTYDVTFRDHPRLVSEYIVQQPGIFDPQEEKNPRATSISDIHYLSPHQFFTMTRDSGTCLIYTSHIHLAPMTDISS